jgi:hypothetical protein
VPVVRPEILGFGGADLRTASTATDLPAVLFEAFARDDQAAARGIIVGSFLSGTPVAAICDGPIRGALERLGELWKEGPEGIVLEHRAVDTTVQAMSLMRATVAPPPPGAPIALGGAIAGDPYILPSMGAALVLADAGYVEVNLGPDVPTETLLEACARYRPALVWRTMSAQDDVNPRSDITRIAERVLALGGQLVVGGRTSSVLEGLADERFHLLASMGELAAFGRGLLASRRLHPETGSGIPPAP